MNIVIYLKNANLLDENNLVNCNTIFTKIKYFHKFSLQCIIL